MRAASVLLPPTATRRSADAAGPVTAAASGPRVTPRTAGVQRLGARGRVRLASTHAQAGKWRRAPGPLGARRARLASVHARAAGPGRGIIAARRRRRPSSLHFAETPRAWHGMCGLARGAMQRRPEQAARLRRGRAARRVDGQRALCRQRRRRKLQAPLAVCCGNVSRGGVTRRQHCALVFRGKHKSIGKLFIIEAPPVSGLAEGPGEQSAFS